MKRAVASIIIVVLVLSACFALFACNNNDADDKNSSAKLNRYTAEYLNALNAGASGVNLSYTASNSDISYKSGETRSPYSRFYTTEYVKMDNPRYARVNSCTFVDDEDKGNVKEYDIYLVYLGQVNNVPLAYPYGAGFLFTGNTLEQEFAKTVTTEESVEQTVTRSSEKSFSRTASESINMEVSISLKETIKALFADVETSYNLNVGTGFEYSESVSNTTAFSQSRKNVVAHGEALSQTYKLKLDKDSPHGYYRFVVMGQLDVFATVVFDEQDGKYKYSDTLSIVNEYYNAVDYSATDPSFSDIVAEPFTLDDSILEDLSDPTITIKRPEEEAPVKNIIIRLDCQSLGKPYGANDSATVSKSLISVPMNTRPNDLPVPACDGFVFLGWFNGDKQITNASGAWINTYLYNSDQTLNARWLPLKYTFLDDGTVNGKDIKGNKFWTGTFQGKRCTWHLTNDYVYNVDLNKRLDLSKHKALGYNNLNIYVELEIAEINNGYQCIRVKYNSDKWDEKVIEHGGSKCDTNFYTYTSNSVTGSTNSLGTLCVVCRGIGDDYYNSLKVKNVKVIVEVTK